MQSNNSLTIGCIIDAKEDISFINTIKCVIQRLREELKEDFPEFAWSFQLIQRKDFPVSSPLDPIELLEFGSGLKLEYGLDFMLVFTSLPLQARYNQVVNAVPSNMLETAVITLARILENREEHIYRAAIGLCKHTLGHLWGLEHTEDSVMKPLNLWTNEVNLSWREEEKKHILSYLQKIADPRLEETSLAKLSKFRFYLHVIKHEGISILRDILLCRSWLMMLHLGKFTAATAVSIIFLFLSAEAWEMGAAIRSDWVDVILAAVLIGATLSLYFGQNLHKVAYSDRIMEQAVRSKLVLFGTLLIGMFSFWLNLFVISLIIIYFLPHKVLLGWAGIHPPLPIFHFAKIMATFGIMASALGGNLEEEKDLKAVLFYTEET